ncbi:MAG: oligosaccharide flippase family protein [Prevotella sp.]|nr:oligosaccharide flippase family protein [Prevotella sp.]
MKEQKEDYNHILKYTSLFGGIQGLVIVISLIRNKAMALLLGVSGVGFNALLLSMQNFAAQCTNLGLSFGAVPRLSELYEHDDHAGSDYFIQVIRLWSIIAAVLGLLFCIVVSPLVNNLSFNWGNHTLHYAMLGISVAFSALAGGEFAILKATRRLGPLARVQIYTAVVAVVCTIPLYYYLRHTGVVPAIVLTAMINMLFVMSYSYRHYPFRLRFERQMFIDGAGMIRLGMAFVLASAVGSGSEMLIRSFLNVEGSMDDVGLYNAAYMITITYAGLVFTAMETDFFPRLSAVSKDVEASNNTVNRQMEVSLLMLSPMLVALLMFLPLLIPALFSKEFLPVIGMAQVAVLAMYFKVLTLPVAYITLARGYSLTFLFLESAYFVVLVTAIAIGFTYWGIYGTGVAIVFAHVFDYLMINSYAYWKYDYRSTWAIVRYASVQLTIGFLAFVASLMLVGWGYWTAEAALAIVSTAYSVNILRQKTHLWESLKQKIRI